MFISPGYCFNAARRAPVVCDKLLRKMNLNESNGATASNQWLPRTQKGRPKTWQPQNFPFAIRRFTFSPKAGKRQSIKLSVPTSSGRAEAATSGNVLAR